MREILKGYYDKSLWVSGAICIVGITFIILSISGIARMSLWVAGGVGIVATLNLALIYISQAMKGRR